MKQLQRHPTFSFLDAAAVRSLIFDFAQNNFVHFHRPDGKGYRLLIDAVLQVRV